MTRRETTVRTKRTITIAMVVVVLAVFMAFSVSRGPRRAEARNMSSTIELPLWAEGYELPLRGDDLAVGERFNTFVHAAGIQAEGKDIGARRHVSDGNWSALKSDGADKSLVQSYVDYGKPFYAVAPGTVIACWRNAPNNTPGSLHPDINKIAGGIGWFQSLSPERRSGGRWRPCPDGAIPWSHRQFWSERAVPTSAHSHGEGRQTGGDEVQPRLDHLLLGRQCELCGTLEGSRWQGYAEGRYSVPAAAADRDLYFQRHTWQRVSGALPTPCRFGRDA